MEIIQEEKYGIVRVNTEGRMGAQLTLELERKMRAILKNGQTHLLFDLSSLDYLRSSVLRVIFKRCKIASWKKGQGHFMRFEGIGE
jgi:anti-anti-sigma factor